MRIDVTDDLCNHHCVGPARLRTCFFVLELRELDKQEHRNNVGTTLQPLHCWRAILYSSKRDNSVCSGAHCALRSVVIAA